MFYIIGLIIFVIMVIGMKYIFVHSFSNYENNSESQAIVFDSTPVDTTITLSNLVAFARTNETTEYEI